MIKTKKITELIKLFRLEKILKKRSKPLSDGRQMKASIEISLINNPKILFLDEPALGLKQDFKRFIKKTKTKNFEEEFAHIAPGI